jgi:hypothetical protein
MKNLPVLAIYDNDMILFDTYINDSTIYIDWNDCIYRAMEMNNMKLVKHLEKRAQESNMELDYDLILFGASMTRHIDMVNYAIEKGGKNFDESLNISLCMADRRNSEKRKDVNERLSEMGGRVKIPEKNKQSAI